MPSRTWTPDALSSERRRIAGSCWRAVEGQHRVSTMKLVDTLGEQEALETLVERSKPPLPAECRHLHYLLSTPFRYGAPYPSGSRFRRAGLTPGVFYASATPQVAIGEAVFHRLLFYADSPATPWPENAGEHTVFSAGFRTTVGLDLTREPFAADRARWRHCTDYARCQEFADAARAAGIRALRYESARIAGGRNTALLTCRVFSPANPVDRQTWRVHLGATGARAICEFPRARVAFDREAFADDPRIASLIWER
ncbi:MAG TPA: RES family NAD+ phosphorylase [Vicinamibacterales bacterium]|jgi:hypothetical protein